MSDDDDMTYRLAQLSSADPRARARMLQAIAAQPLANRDVLMACEKLLDDREVCLLSIPYRFGEVRFVAAEAVAAVRAALGIQEPVKVLDTFMPCTTDDVARLAKEANVPMGGGVDGVLSALKELVALDRVPHRTITR